MKEQNITTTPLPTGIKPVFQYLNQSVKLDKIIEMLEERNTEQYGVPDYVLRTLLRLDVSTPTDEQDKDLEDSITWAYKKIAPGGDEI